MAHQGTLSGMGRPADDPVIAFESAAAWEAWLAANHSTAGVVWVKVAKKASGIPSVTHGEALDVALCYGWIDGQRNRFDDQWFLQRFTPRRPRSNWSKVNRGKVEQLIREGRMRPAGLREVERARADGRWDASPERGISDRAVHGARRPKATITQQPLLPGIGTVPASAPSAASPSSRPWKRARFVRQTSWPRLSTSDLKGQLVSAIRRADSTGSNP